jgi:hypothetical protein
MPLKRLTRVLTAASKRVLASYLALSLLLPGLAVPTAARAAEATGSTTLRGYTTTVLLGGDQLVIGGETSRGPVAAMAIVSGRTGFGGSRTGAWCSR